MNHSLELIRVMGDGSVFVRGELENDPQKIGEAFLLWCRCYVADRPNIDPLDQILQVNIAGGLH